MRGLQLVLAAAYVVLAAAFWFYGQYDHDPPGGRRAWFDGPLVAILLGGLAIGVGLAIGRVWALLLALAPFALAIPLHLAGNRGDFHDAYLPLDNPFLYMQVVLATALIGVGAAVGWISRRSHAARAART